MISDSKRNSVLKANAPHARKVLFFGPTGAGKTWVGLAVLKTVTTMLGYTLLGISTALADQKRRGTGHVGTSPTKRDRQEEGPPVTEMLAYSVAGEAVKTYYMAGERLLARSGAVNMPRLIRWVGMFDLPVAVVNAFILDENLAIAAWATFAASLQKDLGLTGGEAISIAANVIFGLSVEGLRQLNCGWDDLPAAVFQNITFAVRPTGRYERKSLPTEESKVEEVERIVEVGGVTEVEKSRVLRMLVRMTNSIVESSVGLDVTRALLKAYPHVPIVGTRADLLSRLAPVLSSNDVIELLRTLLPDDQPIRNGQVQLISNFSLVIRPGEVWERCTHPGASALLEEITRTLAKITVEEKVREMKQSTWSKLKGWTNGGTRAAWTQLSWTRIRRGLAWSLTLAVLLSLAWTVLSNWTQVPTQMVTLVSMSIGIASLLTAVVMWLTSGHRRLTTT